MSAYIFDAETERGDEDSIRSLCKPFVKPPPPNPDWRSQVKLGNLKDPAKIDAKIEDARVAYQQAVDNYQADSEAAEQKYWREIIDNAALNPALGRIVCIGVASDTGKVKIIDGDEADILSSWWSSWEARMLQGFSFVGHNIFEFDLPFLRIRSWVNRVTIPASLRDNRWWNRCFIDVRQEWLSGRPSTKCESNLDHIGKAMGLGGKLPGDIGAKFGRLWRGTPEERQQALAYINRDLELTAGIAKQMGIIREKAA